MRLIAGVLLGYLGLVITCCYAPAEYQAARPLNLKEAVQLALRQNPTTPDRAFGREREKSGQKHWSICAFAAGQRSGGRQREKFQYSKHLWRSQPDAGRPFPGNRCRWGIFIDPVQYASARRYQASRQDVKTASFQEMTVEEQVTALIVTEYLRILRATAIDATGNLPSNR
jgi:hypothetical protein